MATDEQTTPTVLHLIEKARAAQQQHEQRHDVQLEINDWRQDDKGGSDPERS